MNKDKLFVVIGLVLVSSLLLGIIGWRTSYVVKDTGETGDRLRVLEQPDGQSFSSGSSNDVYREEGLITSETGRSSGGGSGGGSVPVNNGDSGVEKVLKSIDILIQSEKEVYAFDMSLNFDKNKVEIVEVAEGDFLNSDGEDTFSVDKSEVGFYNFALTRFKTQEGVSGEGVMVKINYKVEGESEINFDFVLVDSNLNKLNIQFVEGKIIVL